MDKLMWRVKMFVAKLRHPNAGYYERLCLINGFSKRDINEWIRDAISKGEITENNLKNREDICSSEVSYWCD